MPDLKDEITSLAKEMGIDKIGFTTKERLADLPPSGDIEYVLPGGRSAISLCVAFDKAAMRPYFAKQEMWAHNTDHKAAYFKLKMVAQTIKRFLEEKGHQAETPLVNNQYRPGQPPFAMVPPLSNKYVAIASGMGWFGWNRMVLTPEFGSPVAFTSVVTSAELEADEPLDDPGWCESCKLCVASCPTHYFTKDGVETHVIAGKTYRHNSGRSNLRCLVCCGGCTGVNDSSATFGTWAPIEMELPRPEEGEEAFRQKVLEYCDDPDFIRLKWLLRFSEGEGVHSWDDFDYTYLVEEVFTCGHCMMLCWPDMDDRKQNWRILKSSGRISENKTYMKVSAL